MAEEVENTLHMNGTPMTVTALAWLAIAAEKHGSAHIVGCAKAAVPGVTALLMGAELQRLGFFDEKKEG